MSNPTHPPTAFWGSPAELRECEKSGHHPPPPMITSTRNVQVFMHARARVVGVVGWVTPIERPCEASFFCFAGFPYVLHRFSYVCPRFPRRDGRIVYLCVLISFLFFFFDVWVC